MDVLIVDDNAAVRRMLRSLLSESHYTISEERDGSAAIAQCERHAPDVVLMDVEMQPVDGIAATSEIKRRWPGVRVFIVSNYGDKRTRAAAAKVGADGFVEKEHLIDVRALIEHATT
ncbi:MAG: hypothetical protein A3H45_14600 [Ignavibacteria bacterium RIFCSPLOWO2_02_FULL_55_14]|nr:MAG: hypothetical protein A3H45_14600 [Ignavibacteria bacterium RIFCSPLOWO2_02_FULL_55_14]